MAAVACVAAAMLLLEVVVTRLFSVMFFYHFSFFAISLVMSGLVIGGILVSRWNVAGMPEGSFSMRLAILSALFSLGTGAGLVGLILITNRYAAGTPSLMRVGVYAMLFLPGLVAAGGFLALAFARNARWIGKLYAADLLAAAAACIGAIAALRTLEGAAAVALTVVLAAMATLFIAPVRWMRWTGLALITGSLVLMGTNSWTNGKLLRLNIGGPEQPVLERWNEHSRVRAYDDGTTGRWLIIDRSAGTFMRHLPPPVQPQPWWGDGAQYKAYVTKRPLRTVAVIGVGGGVDLFPALHYGAERVDGYELNRTMIDLLQNDYKDYNGIARLPQIRLIHEEARLGIAHSGQQYDVIQASLIDTWAATASGGFVLSENALYTREGWRVFLDHLTSTGILTMTRWHLPDAPAETQRLVSLAAAALADAGFADATPHVVLLRSDKSDDPIAFSGGEVRAIGTILVSKTPFTMEEVQRLNADAIATGGELMAAPGVTPGDSVIANLLSPDARQSAIERSPFNIAAPTDLQPHFFLQMRISDLFNLRGKQFGPVTEITFNGVRVMMVLAICSISLVIVVGVLTALTLPGSAASAPARRVYRWMTLYFLGIGLGYILVQISLLQRLIIVLGRPTLALSVVLFSMLLGTGAGAACSERIFPGGNLRRCIGAIVVGLVVLRVALAAVPLLESVGTASARIAIVSLVLAAVGFILGCAFPLGVRSVAPTGEWAIQKMWAINGAASIAASVLAAVIGLAWGSGAVLTGGIVAYGLALVAAARSS